MNNAVEEALRTIAENAEAWHGPPPPGLYKGPTRALAVIAKVARAALAKIGDTTEEGREWENAEIALRDELDDDAAVSVLQRLQQLGFVAPARLRVVRERVAALERALDAMVASNERNKNALLRVEEARETIRKKSLHATGFTTVDRDTYADGYQSGLAHALDILAAALSPDCPECGAAPGAAHKDGCFFLTGDPAALSPEGQNEP